MLLEENLAKKLMEFSRDGVLSYNPDCLTDVFIYFFLTDTGYPMDKDFVSLFFNFFSKKPVFSSTQVFVNSFDNQNFFLFFDYIQKISDVVDFSFDFDVYKHMFLDDFSLLNYKDFFFFILDFIDFCDFFLNRFIKQS